MVGPDDEYIDQEVGFLDNMTEGQLADYLAVQAMNEPDCD